PPGVSPPPWRRCGSTCATAWSPSPATSPTPPWCPSRCGSSAPSRAWWTCTASCRAPAGARPSTRTSRTTRSAPASGTGRTGRRRRPKPPEPARPRAARSGLAVLPDDHHGAGGVLGAALADRAEHGPREAAPPPVTDHEQVRPLRGPDQHLRRVALDQPLPQRSEEHTSELQSRENLVCRLLLEKKK